ncbi:FAD-binding oxidoreductase [Litorivivens sp.]|uniref:FAD-binding oxidoreductase n=1 Tax=Litorivivens sp. TaxID=2020868 RepID=UPI003568AD35
MATVKLVDSSSFECTTEESILDAARKNGILMEYSCRTGRCGACKTKVIQGETSVIQSEDSLSHSESEEGYILTCCRAAASTLHLEAEDLGALGIKEAKTLPCRIDSMNYLADDILCITFRTPPDSSLDYLPGQYIEIIGAEGLRRSYSIANAPRVDGKVSIHVRRVQDGRMSNYWFSDARVGDLLRLEGPMGTFCLRKSKARSLIFLATGTGIAPIKAMLEQYLIAGDANHFDQIFVYWGGRYLKDIYWAPEFETLPLSFVPTLSRESWGGRKGYVQQAVLDDKISLDDSVVYACGSEDMIRSASSLLISAGLHSSNFYSDAFVSSS